MLNRQIEIKNRQGIQILNEVTFLTGHTKLLSATFCRGADACSLLEFRISHDIPILFAMGGPQALNGTISVEFRHHLGSTCVVTTLIAGTCAGTLMSHKYSEDYTGESLFGYVTCDVCYNQVS